MHVRFEQFDTLAASVGMTLPFSLGLMVSSLQVNTTIDTDRTHKEVRLALVNPF